MNFFEDKFQITSNYGEKFAGKKDFVIAKAEEPFKLYYKIDNVEYVITYDENYKFKKLEGLTEGTSYEGEELQKMDDMGILQRFKNYDPRFIIKNFKEIKKGVYKQILPSFLNVNSYHIFTFDKNGYTKQAFMKKGSNIEELKLQKLEFTINI